MVAFREGSLKKAGDEVSINGKLKIDNLPLASPDGKIMPTNFDLSLDANYNLASQSASLNKLSSKLRFNNEEKLNLELKEAITLNLLEKAPNLKPKLAFNIKDLDLAYFNVFRPALLEGLDKETAKALDGIIL